jgi:excisionase family DNA binding protein
MTIGNSPQVTTNILDAYVTIGQASRLLLVNRATTRRWVKQGRLRGQKMGLVTLIPKEDVSKVAKERGTNIM